MRTLLVIVGLIFIMSAHAEIYSWKDSEGRTVYGDNPPEDTATQTFTPEPLMIIPGYQDPADDKKANKSNTKTKADGDDQTEVTDDNEEEVDKPPYSSFKITYPTTDEVVRANNGSLFMSMQLSPALAASDSVFVYVNGKKFVENSKALSVKVEQLDRGEHNMFAVVRNDKGDVLINSNTVKFSVLRNSVIQ